MSHVGNDITSKKSSGNDKQIHFMLKALEARVNEVKDNVSVSQAMLPLGIDTDLTLALKKLFENPLSHLLEMRQDMDGSIGAIIKLVATEFFKLKKKEVKKAFTVDSGIGSELNFYIILNEDSSENRASVYTFLSEYKSTKLWNEFPVYFQIVPPSINDSIKSKEILFEN